LRALGLRSVNRLKEDQRMAETIYASFADPANAERAVGALLDHGVRDEDISLVSHESYRRDDMMNEMDDEEDEDPVATAKHGISTTTGADAASGAITGAGVGLGVGAVAAIASMFLPGIGLITGGGALAAALAGAAATTAAGGVVGGVTGYLKDQGVPEVHAARYHEAVHGGGAVVAVVAPSNEVSHTEIHEVLAKYGAGDFGRYGSPVM
jgi:hypothetical protein